MSDTKKKMSKTKVLFIGDPHVQCDNITEVNELMNIIDDVLDERGDEIDCICVGGDLLHDHERLHAQPLNKCYEFVQRLSAKKKTFLLVGNHDFYNNRQFLSTKHWMNVFKPWAGVTVVDHPMMYTVNKTPVAFFPYVPAGMFSKAAQIFEKEQKLSLSDTGCVFAHQEFRGCIMGAFRSVDGDVIDPDIPLIVSGHIHNRQRIGNVFYPGVPMQHNYTDDGMESNEVICLVDPFHSSVENIEVKLPRKITLRTSSLKDVKKTVAANPRDKFKVVIKASEADIKKVKRSKLYDTCKAIPNVKILFERDEGIDEGDSGDDEKDASCFWKCIEEEFSGDKDLMDFHMEMLAMPNPK